MIEGSEIDGASREAPVTYPPKPSMNKLNHFPGMQGRNPNFQPKESGTFTRQNCQGNPGAKG